MKKLLIASVIAATAFSAVADETTLYGSIAYNTGVAKTRAQKESDSRWNLDTDELNWGIKGEENISSDLNAFWHIEFGEYSGGVAKTNKAYVGLRGDSWGTLTLGSQDSLVKKVTDYNDIFDAVNWWGAKTKYAEQLDVPDRVISYVSPNWSGFQFGLAGILNGKDNTITDRGLGWGYNGIAAPTTNPDNKSFGAGQIGVWYDNYGFYGSLAYQQVDRAKGIKDDKLIAAAIGYKTDDFKVGLTEKHLVDDGDKLTLAGEYYMGPHTVRAGVGLANSKELNRNLGKYCYQGERKCGSKNVYTYALGYKYNLSKRTYTYIEGLYADNNTKKYRYAPGKAGLIRNPGYNEYEVKVGLKHDF